MKRACLLLLPAMLLSALFVSGCDDESKPQITRIRVSPACGVVPLEVEAYALASGGNESGDPLGGNNKLEFAWNFGDGGTGATSRAYHTYQTAGDYNVVVTATDPDGESDSRAFVVRALADSLLVNALMDAPETITTNDTIQFHLEAESCDLDYPNNGPDVVKMRFRWEMGDAAGTVYTGPEPQHQFLTAGEYVVRLTVGYNDWAVWRSAELQVTVVDP
jgi:hypothetical protein